MNNNVPPAHASGELTIGGELTVHRLGFGAMRLPGVWEQRRSAADAGKAVEILRDAVRLGVNFIDTAEAYGPDTSERLIADALRPYPENLVIATKGGLSRDGSMRPDGRPERLREGCEGSLRRLGLDTIDLWQLHQIDPAVSLEDQFGTIRTLQDEGKIRFVGVSEVSVEQLRSARELVDVDTVQNRFNYSDRGAEDVLTVCEAGQIGFIPWNPLGTGDLVGRVNAFTAAAVRHGVTASQLAIAWLLRRSPVMLPIPGTGSREHLRENIQAALIELPDGELTA